MDSSDSNNSTKRASRFATAFAKWSHPVMFYLSLVFLALLSTIIVLWIDVAHILDTADPAPAESAAHIAASQLDQTRNLSSFEYAAYALGRYCGFLLLALWCVFIAEQLTLFVLVGSDDSYFHLYPLGWVSCIIPPLRMCMRQRTDVDRVWLPRVHWQVVDRRLQRDLEKVFSVPMIWIALLILPVFGVQLYFKDNIVNHPALQVFSHVGTGLIWFAFATEFIVMASVADKKLVYCKKHWLDLLIILLPLVYFLRSARLLRATKLAKIGKLQQLSRVARVYRLRGVAMRALRALMLLEVIHRLLRTKPEKRIAKLEEQYSEKVRELEFLREEIDKLQAQILPDESEAKTPETSSDAGQVA